MLTQMQCYVSMVDTLSNKYIAYTHTHTRTHARAHTYTHTHTQVWQEAERH